MFLMCRALNEFDIACNPLNNELASKKLIYDLTLSYLESKEKILKLASNIPNIQVKR